MIPFVLPSDYPRIQRVNSFQELVMTPFAGGVNGLCWPRTLPGDFSEVARLLGGSLGVGRNQSRQLDRYLTHT